MKKLVLSLLLSIFSSSYAATIAIVDSGTDMQHEDIAPFAWRNPVEIPLNMRDEDRNGYPDDVFGWNFAESNSEVIDYRYLNLLNDDVRKFFQIQGKAMMGMATSEEINWLRQSLQDEDFLKRLQTFGNFMHGTHVAGITLKENVEDIKLMGIKLIPTEVKLPGKESVPSDINNKKDGKSNKLALFLFKIGLKTLAKQQMNVMKEIADYVNFHKVDVVNGSFGTGFPQALMIIDTLFQATLKRSPTDEEKQELVLVFFQELLENGKKMLKLAPKTLFVFAAGNDGLNNDKYPISPTNLIADNEISVAATLKRFQLAPFSNYGEKMVDVAAPGVSILSAVPGNEHLEVSGTSQATPHVAGIAVAIKEINKSLTPKDIKTIIMETVDVKDFLKGKVKSSGVVNRERALKAAELSKSFPLNEAISSSLEMVLDVFVEKDIFDDTQFFPGLIPPLPSTFLF